MKIPISNNGLIKNYLSKSGGEFLLSIIQDKAKQVEDRFNRDQIPEENRIGAQAAYVLPLNYSIVSFTIERTLTGWVLVSWGSSTITKEGEQLTQKQIC